MIVCVRINNWEEYFKMKAYLESLNFKWFNSVLSPKFNLLIHLLSGKISHDPNMNVNENHVQSTVEEFINKGLSEYIF